MEKEILKLILILPLMKEHFDNLKELAAQEHNHIDRYLKYKFKAIDLLIHFWTVLDETIDKYLGNFTYNAIVCGIDTEYNTISNDHPLYLSFNYAFSNVDFTEEKKWRDIVTFLKLTWDDDSYAERKWNEYYNLLNGARTTLTGTIYSQKFRTLETNLSTQIFNNIQAILLRFERDNTIIENLVNDSEWKLFKLKCMQNDQHGRANFVWIATIKKQNGTFKKVVYKPRSVLLMYAVSGDSEFLSDNDSDYVSEEAKKIEYTYLELVNSKVAENDDNIQEWLIYGFGEEFDTKIKPLIVMPMKDDEGDYGYVEFLNFKLITMLNISLAKTSTNVINKFSEGTTKTVAWKKWKSIRLNKNSEGDGKLEQLSERCYNVIKKDLLHWNWSMLLWRSTSDELPINDMHLENMMTAGNTMYITDMECGFGPCAGQGNGFLKLSDGGKEKNLLWLGIREEDSLKIKYYKMNPLTIDTDDDEFVIQYNAINTDYEKFETEALPVYIKNFSTHFIEKLQEWDVTLILRIVAIGTPHLSDLRKIHLQSLNPKYSSNTTPGWANQYSYYQSLVTDGLCSVIENYGDVPVFYYNTKSEEVYDPAGVEGKHVYNNFWVYYNKRKTEFYSNAI